MTTRPICITLLASEWASSKGGLSTMNRELAIQLAKLSNTSVSFLVPKCSDENKREASNYKVNIVTAEERPGFAPIDWLTFPPEDLDIDFVVGHGVILGKQAQIIRNSHQCKWVQVVHTAPDELAVYKEYSGAISKGEEKQSAELKLCKMADIAVAIGPKLTEFYAALLNSCGKKVFNFTPGIFNEFASLSVSPMKGKKFRILVFGRGDTEDFKLKGYDIAAKAVAKLVDKTYHLTFVGASKGSESDVTRELLKHDLLQSQLIVKGYLENREDLVTLLCASNLVIIPSRTEGFGLTALEALSAGIPFLVGQNSGFGEALQEIPRGSAFIVDSEDPDAWAEAINTTRQKGSDTAFQECQELRALYAEKYKWEKQSEELLKTMKLFIKEDDQGRKRQTSTATPETAAGSPNPRTSELHTSLPKLPDKKKSDETPSKEVPEEVKVARIRPTSQGARPKHRNSIATESPPESTVRQGDKVLIVIGGDDRYKDEDEEDTAFISRWAKRKISSQFSEDLIDGRESFIFSWNQEHREIHEEALVHFLNQRKRGEEFEYQPKGKSSETAMSPKANESNCGKDPQEWKSTQGQNRSNVTRPSTFAAGDKPTGMNTHPGASCGNGVKENRTPDTGKDGSFHQGGTEPLQSTSVRKASPRETTSLHTRKEGSSRMNEGDSSVGYHPLQKDTSRKASSSSGYTPLHSGKEGRVRGMSESDHSVGSDPFQSGMYFQWTRPFEIGSFGRMGESDYSVGCHPLQSDALGNPSSGVYPSLDSDKLGDFQNLAAAESSKQTLQKDLSILGWDASPEAMAAVVNLINRHRDVLSLSTHTDCVNSSGDVDEVISYFEHNPLKYCMLIADADKIKAAMIKQEKGVNPRLLQTADRRVEKGIIITVCCPWFQSEQDKSLCKSAIKKAFRGSNKVYITWFENGNWSVSPDDLINFLTSYPFPQQPSAATYCPPRGITGNQRLPYPWNYNIYLFSGKTVLVLTRIRKGIISDQTKQPEDVQYWKPGFAVPREIEADLYKKNAKTSNGELFVLMTKEGKLTCQVNTKDGKDWQNFILLGLDETIVLQTQLRYGQISFEGKDAVIQNKNLRVPQEEITKLEQNYKKIPSADLIITSDPKGNSRCVVKALGPSSKVFTFITTLWNRFSDFSGSETTY